MSSRSERYVANAEKCQQFADAANMSGTKRRQFLPSQRSSNARVSVAC
jgi:hypothetical protein